MIIINKNPAFVNILKSYSGHYHHETLGRLPFTFIIEESEETYKIRNLEIRGSLFDNNIEEYSRVKKIITEKIHEHIDSDYFN
jgi:hypothetical protein